MKISERLRQTGATRLSSAMSYEIERKKSRIHGHGEKVQELRRRIKTAWKRPNDQYGLQVVNSNHQPSRPPPPYPLYPLGYARH